MFTFDHAEMDKKLQTAGENVRCAPVDVRYLRGLWEGEVGRF